ncbi:hypothetical protein GCM10018966_032310 [Streptomyces yanii]
MTTRDESVPVEHPQRDPDLRAGQTCTGPEQRTQIERGPADDVPVGDLPGLLRHYAGTLDGAGSRARFGTPARAVAVTHHGPHSEIPAFIPFWSASQYRPMAAPGGS